MRKLTSKAIKKQAMANTLRLADYPSTVRRFENMRSHGVDLGFFDRYIKKHGKVITERGFAEVYLNQTLNYFEENNLFGGTEAVLNEELVNTIINRAIRSYRSYIYEEHAAARIRELFPELIVAQHNLIDTVGGIDIVLADPETDKIAMIHITNDLSALRGSIEEKEGRSKHRKYVEGSHFTWGYQGFNSICINRKKGELCIFSDSFLKKAVKDALENTTALFSENIELKELNQYLKKTRNTGIEDLVY